MFFFENSPWEKSTHQTLKRTLNHRLDDADATRLPPLGSQLLKSTPLSSRSGDPVGRPVVFFMFFSPGEGGEPPLVLVSNVKFDGEGLTLKCAVVKVVAFFWGWE